MKIIVTEQDILQGVPKSINQCPVALAVRRLIDRRIMIDGARLYTYDDRYVELCVDLPENVTNWIADYDNGKDVNPISFEVLDLWQ
jgi:hypothetical protein